MRLTLWILGVEVITLDLSRDQIDYGNEPGDCLTDAHEVGDIEGGVTLGFTTRAMQPCEFE